MQARLAAKNLACRRGDRLLFTGLDIVVETGGALQVRGANGVGKSSLMRILAGLARPFAGQVECEGSVALVDERLALDEHAPLGEALAFWQRLDSCTDPAPALERMALTELADVPVRYLSTGQRKRAAFARLLNAQAQIWLLDEPLNGLDSAAQDTVEALIAGHVAAGGICVVASHQTIALPAGAQSIELAGDTA